MTPALPDGPPGGSARDERRWLAGVGILAVVLVGAIPPLRLLYSDSQIVTFYTVIVVALMCEAAETVDAWRLRRAGDDVPATADPGFSWYMRWVVVFLVLILLLTGLDEVRRGAGGERADNLTPGNLVVGGLLAVAASGLSLLLFFLGTTRVPGLRALRDGRPITWFAIFVVLASFAQNLAPATGSQGVQAVIGSVPTTGDLLVTSLPYGAIGLLAVGPLVRRNLRGTARRLGALPLRPHWALVGAGAGILLVPGMNFLFAIDPSAGVVVATRLLPLGVVAVLMLVPRLRRAVLADSRLRLGAGVVVSVAALLALGLAVAWVQVHLPIVCVQQQQQVAQSLSGGPMGRPWTGNVAIALAAGIDEELLFRGAVQPRFGLILASLLFASFHVQYTCNGVPSVGDIEIVVLGLAFGVLRRWGGLAAAVMAHAAYDGSVLLNLTLWT